MTESNSVKFYSDFEEGINIGTHVFGFFVGIIALGFLVVKAVTYGNINHIVSFTVYGTSVILLFLASAMYHSAKNPQARKKLKVFDHAAIYIVIAGSYTPYALVTLKGNIGWMLLGASWGVAIIGIVLKLFFTGRFSVISTLAYVLMGWMVVFVFDDLVVNLPADGIFWLVAGGVFFTIGAIIYSIHKIKLNHAIFHFLGLFGFASHFISIYFYVLEV